MMWGMGACVRCHAAGGRNCLTLGDIVGAEVTALVTREGSEKRLVCKLS